MTTVTKMIYSVEVGGILKAGEGLGELWEFPLQAWRNESEK